MADQNNPSINPSLAKVLGGAFGGSPTPAASPQPTPEVPPPGGPPSGSMWDALKGMVQSPTDPYQNAADVLSHKKGG